MRLTPIAFAFLAFSSGWGFSAAAPAAEGPYFARFAMAAPAFLPTSIDLGGRMPYFAEHPPVYYGYPESRPYAQSPYLYPPLASSHARRLFCPKVAAAQLAVPQVIVNPHVAERPSLGLEPSPAAGRPEVLVNPFAASDREPSSTPEARLPRRVDVTYPAALFAQTP